VSFYYLLLEITILRGCSIRRLSRTTLTHLLVGVNRFYILSVINHIQELFDYVLDGQLLGTVLSLFLPCRRSFISFLPLGAFGRPLVCWLLATRCGSLRQFLGVKLQSRRSSLVLGAGTFTAFGICCLNFLFFYSGRLVENRIMSLPNILEGDILLSLDVNNFVLEMMDYFECDVVEE